MKHHRNAAFSWSMALRFNRWLLWMLCLGTTVGIDLSLGPNPPIAQAQITPDQTLGSESSVVVPDIIQGITSDRIEGGAIRADVLFHSFDEFNVEDATAAYFANPDRINTILSRVTGTQRSDIMGRLGVLGEANLFLLNPNGIIFGPHSSLDINGSFLATTADEFTFADGHSFSAIAANAPPLLRLNVPIGLQYGSGADSAVVNAGSLAVDPGNALTLVGSSVLHTGSLTAPGGNVAIAAIAHPTHLQLDQKGHLATITPTHRPSIDSIPASSLPDWLATDHLGFSHLGLSGEPTGEITSDRGTQIPAAMITAPGNVLMTGSVNASRVNLGGIGGHVQVLGDRVRLIDRTAIDVSGRQGGGVIHIGGGYRGNGLGLNARQTLIGPQVTLQADALSHGPGGDVFVWADDRTHFHGTISAQGGPNGGNGGFVEVSGKQRLTFGGHVDLSAPQGVSGRLLLDPENIIIVDENGANDATLNDGQILVEDGSTDSQFTITEETLENISGTAEIILEATNDVIIQDLSDNELELTGDSAIRIVADADGDGRGNFTMSDRGDAIFSNGQDIIITGAVLQPGQLNSEGGDITLVASDRIQLLSGSEINSGQFDGIDPDSEFNDFTQDFAGDITLTAANDIQILSASITSDGGGNGARAAGDIRLTSEAGSIHLQQSEILSEVLSQGFAGSIRLNANDGISLRDSTISSNVNNDFGNGVGGAGLIQLLATGDIRLARGRISAESIGTKETENKGRIAITSRQGVLRILLGTEVSTQADTSGFAGAIALRARQGTLRISGSDINSNFDANDFDINDPSDADGGAGEIDIVSRGPLIITNDSTISASSFSVNEVDDASGSILLRSSAEDIIIDDSRISTTTEGSGSAGEIDVRATRGFLHLIGEEGTGDNNTEGLFTEANQGAAGSIQIIVRELMIDAGARLSARTATGTAGDINVNINASPATQVRIDGDRSRITARASRATGIPGEITIHAEDVSLSNRAQITAASTTQSNNNGNNNSNGNSNVGNVVLEDVVDLDIASGGQINVRTVRGIAGDVDINTNSPQPADRVSIQGDGSRITARAIGSGGDSGSIDVNARTITVSDRAAINAENISSDDANINSSITLTNVATLDVLNGGQINVRTRTGAAGNVEINPMNTPPAQTLRVSGNNSQITAQAIDEGGDAGRVEINGRMITVSDRAAISAANVSSDDNTLDSSIGLRNVERLAVLSGGQISVSTQRGTARNIDITPPPAAPVSSILVEGNGSSITAQATGQTQRPTAGNIIINTNTLRVNNGGSITVSSPTGIAGNLDLDIAYVVLDDGLISAEIGSTTASDSGANITFTGLDALLMRNNSLISASAIGGAQGGNLTFGSAIFPAIAIGAPSNSNSDLIAIANQGQGGTINLTVAQIEGFTVQNTPFVRNNFTNDISVSSTAGSSGTIAIDTPAINPLGDTIDLPEGLVTTTPLDTLCHSQGPGRSEFIQIGRGGVPRQPDDVIGPQLSSIPWVQREPDMEHGSMNDTSTEGAIASRSTQSLPPERPLVEAQGLSRNQNGRIMLTAQHPNTTEPQAPRQSLLGTCHP